MAEVEERWTIYVCPVCGKRNAFRNGTGKALVCFDGHEAADFDSFEVVRASRFEEVQQENKGLSDRVWQINMQLGKAEADLERAQEELLRQWEYNHHEHCTNEWPHKGACHWPKPEALAEARERGEHG